MQQRSTLIAIRAHLGLRPSIFLPTTSRNPLHLRVAAHVDGTTWDAIAASGIDPAASLERCDAGTALAAVGALVVTGPTGINYADLVLLG